MGRRSISRKRVDILRNEGCPWVAEYRRDTGYIGGTKAISVKNRIYRRNRADIGEKPNISA
ncbi:hypothetical protein [Bacillus sp. SA1-12]|uniref:hypothetical protein n=1 Tax=Bacillus sp. SA1-12 TaxID=1455638 RepID=UPI0012E00DA4|nr:hypothetical protein [Bacillus sp. SA1-12]